MHKYTITLNETEKLALEYATFCPQDWIDNLVHDRCRIAIDEIFQIGIQKCVESQIQIPLDKEDMVQLAYENGWVKCGKDLINDEDELE